MAEKIAMKAAGTLWQHASTMGAMSAGALALGVLTMSSISVVPAGHVGVVDTFGVVRNATLAPGFHVLNPVARVHKTSIKTRMLPLHVKVPTKEGLTVELDAAVLYRLNPSTVVELYKTVGSDFENLVVAPTARSTIRDLTAQFEAKALYTEQRAEISDGLKTQLSERLEQRGLVIEDAPLKRITLPRSLSSAIQSKLEMEQESQRMEFVLQRERSEAERKEIEASGIAKFQNIVTQGINEGVLKWKAIEATERLAQSDNSKLIFIGNPKDGLPIMLGGDNSMSGVDWMKEAKKLEKAIQKM